MPVPCSWPASRSLPDRTDPSRPSLDSLLPPSLSPSHPPSSLSSAPLRSHLPFFAILGCLLVCLSALAFGVAITASSFGTFLAFIHTTYSSILPFLALPCTSRLPARFVRCCSFHPTIHPSIDTLLRSPLLLPLSRPTRLAASAASPAPRSMMMIHLHCGTRRVGRRSVNPCFRSFTAAQLSRIATVYLAGRAD